VATPLPASSPANQSAVPENGVGRAAAQYPSTFATSSGGSDSMLRAAWVAVFMGHVRVGVRSGAGQSLPFSCTALII